jgi:hypothetical protein
MKAIKAMLVALVIMVPPLAHASSPRQALCAALGNVAYTVALARDKGIPPLEVIGILVAAGLDYEIAEGIALSVYSDLIGSTPREVAGDYYLICMGELA